MAGTAYDEGPDLGRGSWLPLFAQGRPGDRAIPNAWQLMVLADASGADGTCPGATDDEVLGVLGQWTSAGSWLESRRLGVIREMIRRRPHPDSVGTATGSQLPWDWDPGLPSELALELGVSVPAARKLVWLAWSLEARLPGIGQALAGGRLDPSRARMVVEETDVLLEPDKLAQAEQMILAGLDECRTWMDLNRLAQRAVVTVDPDGARKRREQEEKEHARIRFWREAAGTCALLGTGLPTDEALAAHANVEQRAQAYRAAGVKRTIDILRVAAYLDILNGVPMDSRLARFAAEDQAQAAGKAGPNGGADGTGAHDDGHGAGGHRAGGHGLDVGREVASEVNLTLGHLDIPLLTAFGVAQRPGEARGMGTLDPALARRLAEAAARHPGSKFCVTIVNEQGHAIGHGCCKPARRNASDKAKGKAPPGTGPPVTNANGSFTITRSGKPGPPGGFGRWLLTLPGRAGQYVVDLHPVPTGECGHQYEAVGHDPGDLLRHLIHVRDGKCGFPVCSRRARESDLEHATPHHKGGRTCGCNCWSCSRSCHQLKQSDGWTVTKPRAGWKQWQTPAGRVYTQEPWRYPS
jgi:hypothetical protein